MFKNSIFIVLGMVMFMLVIVLCMSMHQAENIKREPRALMSKYYRLKVKNPAAAHEALLILLAQDKVYPAALKEAALLSQHNPELEKKLTEAQHSTASLLNQVKTSPQLAYLDYRGDNWWVKTKAIFIRTALFATSETRSSLPFYKTASRHYNNVKSVSKRSKKTRAHVSPRYSRVTNPAYVPRLVRGIQGSRSGMGSLDPADKPRDVENVGLPCCIEGIRAHDVNPMAKLNRPIWLSPSDQAKRVLKPISGSRIGRESKTQLQSLKRAGYLAIQQHHPYVAIDYFTKAYALSGDPNTAMQLGYLYDQVGNKPAAYRFFQWASRSKEHALALRAEHSMTNLSGLQTNALPTPYFSEVFFNPFSESRFGLTVRPFVGRLGVEQNNVLQTKQYVFFRRTDDNKSMNLGQISQIYEDNVQITGLGGQITPILGFPLIGFLEAGAAYDLVYRDRERWRGDFRSGLMYYNEFCARPAYFDKLTFSASYYSDLYGEATYFTRYRNVIAGVKTHQGIRLLQYHSSMVNLYATGRAITDTQRQFYNNFAEIGPGIEFIPSNRWNVKIRLEHVNGVYLPAGATPNPYGQYYINNLAQLLFYVKV